MVGTTWGNGFRVSARHLGSHHQWRPGLDEYPYGVLRADEMKLHVEASYSGSHAVYTASLNASHEEIAVDNRNYISLLRYMSQQLSIIFLVGTDLNKSPWG